MSIDYRKRPTQAAQAPAQESSARAELRYWIDQYNRLTAQLQAAQVTNADQWRKERVDTRKLYSLRAAAAAGMARTGAVVLGEP